MPRVLSQSQSSFTLVPDSSPPTDTVEKNILDLAARQGLSLYTKDNSAGTLNVTPFAMDAEKKTVDSSGKKKQVQKGDFIFK
jgi:E3 ubiquitin-protein ligase SHPRH